MLIGIAVLTINSKYITTKQTFNKQILTEISRRKCLCQKPAKYYTEFPTAFHSETSSKCCSQKYACMIRGTTRKN